MSEVRDTALGIGLRNFDVKGEFTNCYFNLNLQTNIKKKKNYFVKIPSFAKTE